jgi:hypothetical protein
MTPDVLPPPFPPPPPPLDAWADATSRAFPAQTGPDPVAEWLAASGIDPDQRGRRYVLASRDWAWGVLDWQTRQWVRWFSDGMAHDRAWLLWDRLEQHEGVTFWRRANALWITIHVLLSLFVVEFVAAMIAYAIVVAAGVDPERIGTHALPVIVAWVLAPVGWLTFVYLRRPLRARLMALLGSGVLAIVAWLLSVG